MLDYIISIFISFSGFLFVSKYNSKLNHSDIKTLRKLWVYHLLFIFLFYFYTQNNSADANGYWRVAKNSNDLDFLYFLSQGPGTSFMYVVNYLPAKILDLSIFTGMMFYGFLGFLGFYFFYVIIVQYVEYNSKFHKINLFPLLLFLPNIHFWSAGVGKDTLMFFGIGLFSFSLIKINKRITLFLISLFLMYMIRPHVVILLSFSFSLAFLFSNNINKFKKVVFSGLLIGLIIVLLPKVLQYVNLDENSSVDDIVNRTRNQAINLSGENIGSSIDISSYPFPLKILSFLFRPLFFDYNGLFSLFASFENLFLLILTIKIFNKNLIKSFKKSPLIIKGLTYFFISGTILFSLSLSNLGIILRMKNMFYPSFLIFLLWCLSRERAMNLHKK